MKSEVKQLSEEVDILRKSKNKVSIKKSTYDSNNLKSSSQMISSFKISNLQISSSEEEKQPHQSKKLNDFEAIPKEHDMPAELILRNSDLERRSIKSLQQIHQIDLYDLDQSKLDNES